MTGYGFFVGGDPRQFHPDPEMSTDAERAQHKADCDAWDRGECPNVNGKAPHYRTDGEGNVLRHVTPAGYGLGSYEIDDADDMPPDELPHDYDPACECWACYEEGVLRRFRASTDSRQVTP